MAPPSTSNSRKEMRSSTNSLYALPRPASHLSLSHNKCNERQLPLMQQSAVAFRPSLPRSPLSARSRFRKVNLKPLEMGRSDAKTWTNPEVIFDLIDRDGSGAIERSELLKFFRGTMEESVIATLVDNLDANENGTISREEWAQGYQRVGFGQGGRPGKGAEGLSVLMDLISPQRTVNFADLHKHALPRSTALHERGVTIAQLRDIMAHVESRCLREAWVNSDGRRLTPNTVTLYDVVRYVIKPCTEAHRCSYSERVALEPQPPLWLVSHWWGEPFCRTLQVLEQHASDRGIATTCPYWLTAFALNQWNPNESREASTALHHVVDRCIGTLTIIDPEAEALSRTWVLTETLLSICKPQHKWDLYTPVDHMCVYMGNTSKHKAYGTVRRHCMAVGLLDPNHFAAVDHAVDLWARTRNKSKRESFFPLKSLLDKMLALDLLSSKAAPADFRDLLFALAYGDATTVPGLNVDRPKSAEPRSKDPFKDALTLSTCEELSIHLRNRLALVALRNATDCGGKAYQTCLCTLQSSGSRRLSINLNGCLALDVAMCIDLVKALPPSLSHLTLHFKFIEAEAARELLVCLALRLKMPDHRQGLPSLDRLLLETDAFDQPTATALGAALIGHPTLRGLGLGQPTLLHQEDVGALIRAARGGRDTVTSGLSLCAEWLSPQDISLHKMSVNSSDLMLIVASIESGSCGMVNSIDLSENEIDDEGMHTLQQSLAGKSNHWFQDLQMLDLSHNPSLQSSKQAILEDARKCCTLGMTTGLVVSPTSQFRIVPKEIEDEPAKGAMP